MLGKKVLNNFYWHISLTKDQCDEVKHAVAMAETLASLTVDVDYNVIKYDGKSKALSLLWYPDFFDEPFPVLNKSYRIDLINEHIEKRIYNSSLNPPIRLFAGI